MCIPPLYLFVPGTEQVAFSAYRLVLAVACERGAFV